jgi:phosphoribosylanthranilate isomerase
MWTKICANTNVEDALLATKLGANAVGFVFAPSKRQVTPEDAREIVRELPENVDTVGVFATDDEHEIEDAITIAGLSVAQLHCAFSASLIAKLKAERPELKIIQTIPYELAPANRADSDARFEAALRLVFSEPNVWAVLLDAAKSGTSGGLGISFDWERVGRIVARTREAFGKDAKPVILAGGLTPVNVREAIMTLKPWGVDVASGVEAKPGKKDPAKLKAFLDTAKAG